MNKYFLLVAMAALFIVAFAPAAMAAGTTPPLTGDVNVVVVGDTDGDHVWNRETESLLDATVIPLAFSQKVTKKGVIEWWQPFWWLTTKTVDGAAHFTALPSIQDIGRRYRFAAVFLPEGWSPSLSDEKTIFAKPTANTPGFIYASPEKK